MKHRRTMLILGLFRRGVGFYAVLAVLIVLAAGYAFYSRSGDGSGPAANDAQQRDAAALASAGPRSSASRPAPSASVSAPVSPSPSASKPSAKPSTEATKKASGSGGCALPNYPVAGCTGVPPGWRPKTTRNGDLTITKAGTTLTDYLVTGSILVKAANVTIRRTRVYGGIDNFISDHIYGRMTVVDTEVVNPPGQEFSDNQNYAIGVANYTCVRCKIVNRIEGWRIGANSFAGAGGVTIQDSFAQLAVPPALCQAADSPHGDGIQGYGGPMSVIRHNTIDQRLDDCGTSPVFIPDQDNAGGQIDDNLLAGGGYTLRLGGGSFPSVTGNKIVQGTPVYGPLDVDCSKIGDWSGNAMVDYNWNSGSVTKETKKLTNCGG